MSNRTRIKICGILRVEDALHAALAGVDSIGLMFHAPSSRSIDIPSAIEIRKALPPFVTLTALFLDEAEDWIAQVVEQVRPDCLQFHGGESADTCASWDKPYIKAIPMAGELDAGAYAQQYSTAQGFLLDSHATGRRGGSGDTFDWSKIPSSFEYPLILAGGLNPSNVAEAIARVRPWGVDVSSGVESQVAVKNIDLIDQFIDEVKRGDSIKNAG